MLSSCPSVRERVLAHIEGQELDRGYDQRAKPLITLMLDWASRVLPTVSADRFLVGAITAAPPSSRGGKSIPMDDWEQGPYMVDFAASVDLTETITWLRTHWV